MFPFDINRPGEILGNEQESETVGPSATVPGMFVVCFTVIDNPLSCRPASAQYSKSMAPWAVDNNAAQYTRASQGRLEITRRVKWEQEPVELIAVQPWKGAGESGRHVYFLASLGATAVHFQRFPGVRARTTSARIQSNNTIVSPRQERLSLGRLTWTIKNIVKSDRVCYVRYDAAALNQACLVRDLHRVAARIQATVYLPIAAYIVLVLFCSPTRLIWGYVETVWIIVLRGRPFGKAKQPGQERGTSV